MSSRPHLTRSEIERAAELYLSGMTWPEVARVLGRATTTFQHRLGKELSRPLSEVARKRWERRPPGPRHLSEQGQKVYHKLKFEAGHDSASALRMAMDFDNKNLKAAE